MNAKFRFRNFPVYKDARIFVKEMKDHFRTCLPVDERFGLMSQISRALDSIILNIAEGSDRSTDKDFALFLNRSHTSLNEVVACLDIALDCKYITTKIQEKFINDAFNLANQITAFRKNILDNPSK